MKHYSIHFESIFILRIYVYLLKPRDSALLRAFLLLTPAEQENTRLSDLDGFTSLYFSLKSSGFICRASPTSPTERKC